jgi:hypothetical protein
MDRTLYKRLEQQKCDVWSANKQTGGGGAEYSETPNELSQQHDETEMHTYIRVYLQTTHVYLIRHLN